MAIFKDAMATITSGLKDLGTLQVITFSGRVDLAGESATPVKFEDVMTKARATSDVKVKVLASTETKLDGDIVAFYDTDITSEEKLAHADLVEAGAATRTASIEFVKDVVGDAISSL